jgi:hypothetical protein
MILFVFLGYTILFVILFARNGMNVLLSVFLSYLLGIISTVITAFIYSLLGFGFEDDDDTSSSSDYESSMKHIEELRNEAKIFGAVSFQDEDGRTYLTDD